MHFIIFARNWHLQRGWEWLRPFILQSIDFQNVKLIKNQRCSADGPINAQSSLSHATIAQNSLLPKWSPAAYGCGLLVHQTHYCVLPGIVLITFYHVAGFTAHRVACGVYVGHCVWGACRRHAWRIAPRGNVPKEREWSLSHIRSYRSHGASLLLWVWVLRCRVACTSGQRMTNLYDVHPRFINQTSFHTYQGLIHNFLGEVPEGMCCAWITLFSSARGTFQHTHDWMNSATAIVPFFYDFGALECLPCEPLGINTLFGNMLTATWGSRLRSDPDIHATVASMSGQRTTLWMHPAGSVHYNLPSKR